jgi:glutamate-1-semialdehyde aminotransferase/acyl carrier protein
MDANKSAELKSELPVSRLRSLLGDLLGVSPSLVDVNTPFLEMGADSLILLDALAKIRSEFGIKLGISQLFEDYKTIADLAHYIASNLPPDWPPSEQPPPQLEPIALPEMALERIMTAQLQVMSQQLEVLQGKAGTKIQSVVPPSQVARIPDTPAPKPISPQPMGETQVKKLNPRQQQHLEALIARYTKRTQKSKQIAADSRSVLADSRAVAGFRPSIKEMVYPIIGSRAQGAKFWDVDGNEYLDITMGFGVLLFGHGPAFITEALERQLRLGIQIGPQSGLAHEVAELITKLTNTERVTFCNSGTEAVMTALRLARLATNRQKIALFTGSYHGHFDGILARAASGEAHTVPIAPGISPTAVVDVVVLDYDNPQSLELLRAQAGELAAVLVEPVQSRRPNLLPEAFLQELRQLTQAEGIALIFDEVITGFRIHPGGLQAYLGIEADIVIYGKTIGGGLPIGIIAGKSTYMNGIDGGLWNYGDDSYPQTEKTFFAGTFNKNHLGLTAVRAVLQHLQQEGIALQQRLNQQTSQLAITLNAYFSLENVPIELVHFGSLFRFASTENIDLLFYHLLEKGIYIWEGRNCFLSTAHTDGDLDYLIQAVKDSVQELRQGGFLLGSAALATNQSGEIEEAETEHKVPLTEAQKQLWVLAQMGEDGSMAYNESVSLQLQGFLDLKAIYRSLQQVVNHHEALRTVISDQGDFQQILPSMNIDVPLIDFSNLPPADLDEAVQAWIAKDVHQTFNLSLGPLLRVHILKLEEQLHLLVLTAHHIIIDGWSIDIILKELGSIYSAECQGVSYQLEKCMQFKEYIDWLEQQNQDDKMTEDESYWLGQFVYSIPILELPTDYPRPSVQTYAGVVESMTIDSSCCHQIKTLSSQHGCTLFMTLLATFSLLLHHRSGQKDLVIGVPIAGQSSLGEKGLIGYCANILPLTFSVKNQKFSDYLAAVRKLLLNAYDHQIYPFSRLLKKLNIKRDPSRTPLVTVLFGMDKFGEDINFYGLEAKEFTTDTGISRRELTWNVTEIEDQLAFRCNYNSDIYSSSTVRQWMDQFVEILQIIIKQPHINLDIIATKLAESSKQKQLAEDKEIEVISRQKLKNFQRKVVSKNPK